MADNLIFPIGFDLEAAVKKAGEDWDKTYADRLEKLIAKRPVRVKLDLDIKSINDITAKVSGITGATPTVAPKLDTTSFDGALKGLQKSLASVDYTSLTEAESNAIKTLTGAVNSLARAYSEKNKAAALEDKVTQELKAATATEKRAKAELATVKATEQRSKKEANLAIAKANQLKAEENATAATKKRIAAEENLASAQNRRLISERNLAASTARMEKAQLALANAQEKAAKSTRNANKAYHEQSGYLQRLTQRMAAYWSVRQVSQFLTSVREVTAEFELQRVSLGAIIQDQQRANQLFSEIKAFALKSPVSILDLTKYTKQLAAYKIGVDELFDTTKRLTDVSVGLGVSMDRVVLAYGQVRATGYLRASEVRQFTEMGVPIVEELAAKLKKLNGEAVTTAQVMDMISKRGISFELVKEVFDDMTSAGGMFYNMQEKQGNTLFGLWAKLGDAASVMYDEIGNTESVNKGMKNLIELLTSLMRNWREVSQYIGYAGIAIAGLIVKKKILGIEVAKISAIQATYNARMTRANALASANSRLVRAQGVAMGVYAQSMRFASTTAAAFGTSLRAIKSALITTGWGALAVALGVIVDKLFLAKTNAQKAADAISQVVSDTVSETTKSVRNFEYLASKAVSAPKGSSEQKEALEELNRTYNKIIPQELLELEYLDKLNGKYGSLTKTIREYAAEQQKRQAIDEISNIYGPEKQKYERKLTDYFREQGWTEGEIARFWEKFYNVAKDKSKSLRQVVAESLQFAGRDGFEDMSKLLQSQLSLTKGLDKKAYNTLGITVLGGVDYVDVLRDAVLEENKALDQYEERQKAATSATNEFVDAQEKAAERLKKVRFVDEKGEGINRDSYLGSQMLKNFEIKDMTDILKEGFAQAGLAWDNEYGNFINHIDAKTPELISSLNFKAITDAIIQALENTELEEAQRQFLENLLALAQQSKKRYEEIVPSDPVVRVAQTRFQQIAQSAGGFRQNYNQYLMKAGEDMESYNKRLKDSLADLKNEVKGLLYTQGLVAKAGIFAKYRFGVTAEELQKDIDETNKTIEVLEKTISEQPDFSKSKGRTKSDPRLQNLKEEISLTKKLYDEYHKLEKQIGATKAAEKIQEIYSNTIKTLQDRAGKYGFKFDLPFTDENLKSNMQHFIDKMKELQKLRDKKGKPLFPNIGKEIDEAVAQMEDVDLNSLQKALEKKLKELSDRISRTRTAKEFYEKILGITGDVELAANLSLSIYGENGEDLDKAIRDNIQATLGKNKEGIDLDFSAAIRADGSVDYNVLAKIAKGYLDMGEISEDTYNKILKMRDEDRKDLAKTVEGWMKATEAAKTYSDKLLDLRRKTQTEIDKINEKETRGQIPPEFAESQRAGFLREEAEEVAKLQYEAFKDSPMYVQMFDDLDNASTTVLRNMKQRIEELKTSWKDLTPTQLKEMQSRLNEIDAQLVKRNPFKGLIDGIKAYRKLRKGGDDGLGPKSEREAEKALAAASKARLAAESKYLELLHDEGATQEEIAKAKADFDTAAEKESAAAKELEKWKNVKDIISQSANQLKTMTGWGSDIARGIADISEAMGADEEDVQYWNDVADALSEISGGIQDIVSAAMDGNVMGIVSSALTAIPKMFVGFFGLFSAGKVRKANKEIKRQQELLEQLEYTYGRLEKVADKVFGADFVSNMNQQRRLLLAQEQAYMKQYEAEMSKGKKADEDQAQEYLNQARDARDKIADMEGQIAERMTGTDVASAARDFAQAWLEAYASFGSTTDAIKEKFNDMIKNMIVESIMARTVQMALQPMFDKMDEMYKSGASMTDVLGYAFSQAGTLTQQITDGLSVNAQQLEAMGINIREMYATSDNLKGISKNIASASSEEILQLSGFVNTALYYISPIPRMDENLAQIRAIMERGVAPALSAGTTVATQDYTSILTTANEHLSSLPRMEQHLAGIHTMLSMALKTKGSTSGFNAFLNS